MHENVEKGHVGQLWRDEHKFLDYRYDPISQYQLALYVDQGYETIKSFTCEVYDDINVMPPWVSTATNLFGLYRQQYEFLKIRPMDIAPPYQISTTRYRKKYQVDKSEVWHCIMMLEDWRPGQYIEINGEPFANWSAGQWFKWENSLDSTFSYTNTGQFNFYMLHVTGKTTYTGQLHDLFLFNCPGQFLPPEASHPFIQTTIIDAVDPKRNDELIWGIYMDNGYISKLDDIRLTPDQANIISEQGMHLYLFEPMCSYYVDQTEYPNGGTKHTQGFYSEFRYPTDYNKLRSEELDAILKFKERNNIQSKSIHVHTGEYNIEHHYLHYSDHLTLLYDDLCIKAQRPIVNLELSTDKPKFNKHAISLNWRFSKHRQLVANFLAGENVHLSWYFKNQFELLKQDLWFDLESWSDKYPALYQQLKVNNQNILQRSPFCVDKLSDTAVEITDPHHVTFWPQVESYSPGQTPSLYNTRTTTLQQVYDESFVDIVTETRFAQPSGNFSEKVLQPIQYQRPFILLAPPYTLECLQKQGYKTFNSFWDESYDAEEDHGERLAKIFTLINEILAKPFTELDTMYENMLPILQHNKNRFLELTKYPNYKNSEDFE